MSDRRQQSQNANSVPTTAILGNRIGKQVEPVNKPINNPLGVIRPETDLMPNKRTDVNIGVVSTPELRVGDNARSRNLAFENNTPTVGGNPFDSKEVGPLREEPQDLVVGRNTGFTFNRGNFTLSPKPKDQPLLVEDPPFKFSETQDIVDALGKRPRTLAEFRAQRH